MTALSILDLATIGRGGDFDDFQESDGSLKRTFPIGAVTVTPGRGTLAATASRAPIARRVRSPDRSAGGLSSRP